ncbi:MAG TPA: class I adenylate-forming enzyme family protein [Aliidongia sp.]|nr:class I adenylate-forming enzyme family protein [Aliidongia sp.]
MTVLRALYHHAKAHPDGLAFIAGQDQFSYRRLATEVERLARAFIARGVRPGDRVALHMPNVPEMVVANYACFRIGAIAVPLNIRLKTAELQPMLERLRPVLYLGHAQLYAVIEPIEADILPARFLVGGPVVDPRVRPWAALFQQDSAAATLPDPDPEAPALLLATSGTTGLPKFVAHSLTTLGTIADLFGRVGLEDGQIAINAAPMVHASGIFIQLSRVHFGIPTILIERFDPETVLDAIETHRATWLLGLPFMFSAILAAQKARPRNVETLQFCMAGGDVTAVDLQDEFEAFFGIPLRSFWAATESVGSFTYGLQTGPVCRLVPGAEFRLIDENGAPVKRGEVGELLLRGPNTAIGYWKGPNQLDSVAPDGWYHTGDMMRQGEGDEFWFASRKKDLIIRGGSNISPVEVETVLQAHPATLEAAVIGIPDPVLGQRVAGFVRLKDGMPPTTLRDIMADAKQRLADYKLPESLTIVRELPRNMLGKVDRKTLQLMAAQSQADLVA